MADRRATNKYYPPDWEPKHGSINTYVGQHPLRDRARKLDQGILVVRFEMPWNVFCLHCDAHIPIGVRFNAEKSQVGKYHTMPILNFKMKCHHCDKVIEIRTDPEHRDYVCHSGLKRRTTAAADDVEKIMQPNELEVIQADPFKQLENKEEDQEFAEEKYTHLEELKEISTTFYKDDYANSQKLRAHMRGRKKELAALSEESKSKGLMPNILLPKSSEDEREAKSLALKTQRLAAIQKRRNDLFTIKSGSIFQNQKTVQKALNQGVKPSIFQPNQKRKAASQPEGAIVKKKKK